MFLILKKNQKYELKRFGEYDSAFDSKFAFLTNGFAFNNFFGNSENDTTSYLNVVEGFNLKRYVIDFVGDVRQLISDDKYIYLLSKKADNSVYIFNIENKKFYSKYFQIWSEINEPKEIEYVELDEDNVGTEEKNDNDNDNSNKQYLEEQNNLNKKKKKCILF